MTPQLPQPLTHHVCSSSAFSLTLKQVPSPHAGQTIMFSASQPQVMCLYGSFRKWVFTWEKRAMCRLRIHLQLTEAAEAAAIWIFNHCLTSHPTAPWNSPSVPGNHSKITLTQTHKQQSYKLEMCNMPQTFCNFCMHPVGLKNYWNGIFLNKNLLPNSSGGQ